MTNPRAFEVSNTQRDEVEEILDSLAEVLEKTDDMKVMDEAISVANKEIAKLL